MRSDWKQILGALGLLTQVGLSMVTAILLGGGLGWWADRHLGLGVAALVAGILLGVGGGAVSVYKLVMTEVRRGELPPSGEGPGA